MLTGKHRMELKKEFALDQLDLNLLRVFVVLMEERSVTRAADRLNRTQSAVSHSLAKLRAFFNDDIFNRDSGTMEPTPRAKELSVAVSAALANIRSAVDRHLNFEPLETIRNFRIGLTDYTAIAILPQIMREFIRCAPHATLNVLHAPESDIETLLQSGGLDCAVLGNANFKNDSLVEVVLSRDKLICAGWRGSAILSGALTLERYLEAPHLQISSDGVSEGAADRALKRQNLSRHVVATTPHYLVAPYLIRGTELLTILVIAFYSL